MNSNTTETVFVPADSGPIYAETKPGRFPVEPCNTFSNFLFLAIIIYWVIKTRMNYSRHPIITISMPILLVGFIGGTVYHATRSAQLWLILDYMPILILALTGCIYFWRDLTRNWLIAFVACLAPLTFYRFIFPYLPLPRGMAIGIGYSILAASIAAPAVIHCMLKFRAGAKWLLLAVVCFIIAILCRQLDRNGGQEILPMGTHFLWHIFGASSSFFLIKYIYDYDIASGIKRGLAIKKASSSG